MKSRFRWSASPTAKSAFALLLVVCFTAACFSQAGPPRRAQRVEDAVADLNLTPDQQQKADEMLNALRDKEQKDREDFLNQMSTILTPDQLQQLKQKTNQPHPPGGRGAARGPATQPVAAANAPKGTVIFTGGYDTDPRDGGRPVVLIAAALNVTSEVFRDAFSGVHPAGPDAEPQEADVRQNKRVLLDKLGPHGVTDDRLNEVSNFYRYSGSRGQMWKITPATATAIITDGVVTGIKITNPGAGYSSVPTVTVAGYESVRATATVSYGTDFDTNGSIKSITLETSKK